MKFKCCFFGEIDDDSWKEYHEINPAYAAEEFACDRFYGGMYEHNNFWDNEYSVVVEDEYGMRFYFDIEVELTPHFRSICVSADEKEG